MVVADVEQRVFCVVATGWPAGVAALSAKKPNNAFHI
jgi:hypothetical protein